MFHETTTALRRLARRPLATALAVITLGFGIGASAAIFLVLDQTLMRPPPFPEPERIVDIARQQPPISRGSISAPAWKDFAEGQTSFEHFAAYAWDSMNLALDDGARRVAAGKVRGEFFAVYGLDPAVGRYLAAEELEPGAPLRVVLSHSLWRDAYGGRLDVIGSTISLDEQRYEVVGVAPPDLDQPRSSEIWIADAAQGDNPNRGSNYLLMVGRLADGVSLEQADAELDRIAADLAAAYPGNHRDLSMISEIFGESSRRRVAPMLYGLAIAVGLLLLVACIDVANLLLTQSLARSHDLQVRAAMGATRRRLAALLLAESAMIGLASALLAAAVAWGGAHALVAMAPRLPDTILVLDARPLIFIALLGLMSGLACGLLPVVRLRRQVAHLDLAQRGGVGAGPQGERTRRIMTAVQVGMATTLLVIAGWLASDLLSLAATEPGFDSEHTLALSIAVPQAEDPRARTWDIATAAERELATLPGVEAVGVVSNLPLTWSGSVNGGTWVEGREEPADHNRPIAEFRWISPGYFDAMGIPLLKGRSFDGSEGPDDPTPVVVTQALVEKFFPDEEPVGQRLLALGGEPKTIIGVVGDTVQYSLDREISPQLFVSYRQFQAPSAIHVVVRVQDGLDPAELLDEARAAAARLDLSAAVYRAVTLDSVVGDSLGRERFQAWLTMAFAVAALFLSAVGLYGIVTQSVIQRTREMGLRIALGSRPADVARRVLVESLKLGAIGAAGGVVLAWAASRLISSLIFGLSGSDPTVPVLALAVVLVTVALATAVPAIRAARVDPMEALRSD